MTNTPQTWTIEPLKKEQEILVTELIGRNLENFSEAGTVLASTFRRLSHFYELYDDPARCYLVVTESQGDPQPIAGCGLGPLQGLPPSEGLAEIRDLVVDPDYRGHGLGSKLIKLCIAAAKERGYKQIYLQTTPQMLAAQKLFQKFGFLPVKDRTQTDAKAKAEAMPCYYILNDMSEQDSK